MKGFFKWFKSSTKMKRWIFLILLGIVLASAGVSKVIISEEISFQEVGKSVVLFVCGFTCVILGIIFCQKRVLELLIEDVNSKGKKDKNGVDVKSLIFNRKVYDDGPNIVVIGGGTGLNTVLKGLKNYTSNITAIVTVSDYGRVAGYSRKKLNILPLDDIKESLVALSNNEAPMEGLLNLHFSNSSLKDLSFGDIYLLAMEELYGDFYDSIEKCKNILNINGKVLPVTLDEIKICAELKDGTVIEDRDKIPEIVYDKASKINRIFINPSNCKVAPGVIEAIQSADAIIIGPGSLYTNVIPNLLVKNVAKTIRESKAMKVYISNIMTEPGQTDGYSMSEHLNAIIEHAGKGIIDYCIYDTGDIIPEIMKRYHREGADLVEIDSQKAKELGVKLIGRELSCMIDDSVRHSPNGVAEAIMELICNDLKFKDNQNTKDYLLLSGKLKNSKKKRQSRIKILKRKEKAEAKEVPKIKPDKNRQRKSKFSTKYKDRIEAIQNTEENIARNKRLEQEKEEKEKFLKEVESNIKSKAENDDNAVKKEN